MVVDLSRSPIPFNVATVKQWPQNSNPQGLVTQILYHEPLEKYYKGVKMLPQLVLAGSYINRLVTYDIIPSDIFDDFDDVRYYHEGLLLEDGPYSLQNLPDYSLSYPF